ncbi:MAG: L,D-transpeptidase [Microcoleus sp. SIO2G3]|nr:L,D-transpeptidase [Microcoleus sp. SIO2G3]
MRPQSPSAEAPTLAPHEEAALSQQIAESNELNLRVSLSKREVGLYQGDRLMKAYPIAIGQQGWETPTGTFQVMQMIQNPIWIHPMTDERIGAGEPTNPLGQYWIGFWTDGINSIGFHGTSDPDSIGAATSHGCLRMFNPDIEELYSVVQPGMVVTVTR